MKKIVMILAASVVTTALMAQKKADTIQVQNLDNVSTQVFTLPDNFQGDTAYNHVFKSPNGTMQVSGRYHVGPGCKMQTSMQFLSGDSALRKMPEMKFPEMNFPEMRMPEMNFPDFMGFGMPHMQIQMGPACCQAPQQLTKKQLKAREQLAKKKAKAEKKRRIKAIKDAYKYGY